MQLLYFPGCPNVEAARKALQRALRAERLKADIEEIDITARDTPGHLRGWGSPTILIDGADAAGAARSGGDSCRLYPGGERGSRGAPDEEVLLAALRRAQGWRRGWLASAALAPGALLPLLPAATCPACLAAYAGLASTLGLGFLISEAALAPLVIVALLLGVASLAWSGRAHRRPGPLVLAAIGSTTIVSGRLVWNFAPLVYVGVALFFGAALWNLWLSRPRPAPLVPLHPLRKEGGT